MGRPRYNDPPIDKTIALPASLVAAVDESLTDPLTGKPGYGSWSKLTQALLSAWLSREITLPGFQPRTENLDDLLED